MVTRILFALAVLAGLFYYGTLQFPVVRAAESDPLPPELENADPVAMPMLLLGRGEQWVDAQVPLNANASANGYRTDDAGLVNYAWALPLTGTPGGPDWNREVRFHYAAEIPLEAIQPGDALTNWRAGDYGHTLLFEKWLDPSHTELDGGKFIAQEMHKTWHRAMKSVYTFQFKNGAVTIKELEGAAPGPYYALRSNRIRGYVNALDGFDSNTTTPAVGQTVEVKFSILNRGGQPVTVKGLRVAVRGPNAMAEGWKASAADFEVAPDLVLQPGEVYTYHAGRTFEQPGSYFAEPVYDLDGMQSISPSPRVWLTVQ